MADDKHSVIVEVGTTSDKATAELKDFSGELKKTGKDLKAAAKDFESFDEAVESYIESLKEAEENIGSTASQIDKLKKAQDEYNKAMEAAKNVIDWKQGIEEIDEVTAAQDELNAAVNAYIEFRKQAGDSATSESITEHKQKIDDLRKSLEKTEKAQNKFINKLKATWKEFKTGKMSVEKFAHAMQGLQSAVTLGLGPAIQKISEMTAFMKEATQAYNDQADAETALAKAAENNPYMSQSSVDALIRYAREIQTTTGVADNAILQTMTVLTASGRTVAETEKIIAAAADMAAGGAMDFESACDALNKTFTGTVGRMGQLAQGLDGLSESELKNGKAVDILAEKYKGIAEATLSTGPALENAKQNFKEALGELTAPSADMWNNFWQSFYNGGVTVINAISRKIDEMQDKANAKEIAGNLEKEIKQAVKDGMSESDIKQLITKRVREIDSMGVLNEFEKLNDKKINSVITKTFNKNVDNQKYANEEVQNQRRKLNNDSALDNRKELAGNAVRGLDLKQVQAEIKRYEDFLAKHAGDTSKNLITIIDGIEDGLEDAFNGASLAYEDFTKKAFEIDIKALKAREADLLKKPEAKGGKEAEPELDAYEKAKKIFEDTKKNYENELKARRDAGELISREVELQERLSMEASRYVSFQAECLRLQEDESAVFQKHKADYEDTNKAAQELVKNLQAWEKASSDFGKGIEAGNETLEETERYLEDIYKIELTATQKLKDAQRTLSNTLNDLIAKKVHGLEIDREQVAAYAEMKEAQFAAAMATLEASGYSKEQLEVIEKMVAAQQTLNKLKKQEAAAERAQNKQKSDAILDKTGTKGPKQKSWLGQAKEDLSVLKERKSGVKEEKELLLKEVSIPDENNQQRAAQSWADLMANKLKLSEETQAKINALEQEGTDIAEAQNATRLQAAQNAMSMIADISGQVASAMNGLCEMMIGQIEAEADAEREEVARQYNEGAISYEEYCDKKAAIERKAAREKYKVELAQWAIDLTMATVNGAQAVLSALTAGPIIGPIMAAVAGAAAAVQIATVAANKPKPPSFATGGVVGGFKGASMGGDNTTANVRNGEMILNAQQQKQLWGVANGAGAEGGNVSLNVNVVNNAANEVETKQTMDTDGLTVLINKIVAHNMSEGKFTESMDKAEARRDGERWL